MSKRFHASVHVIVFCCVAWFQFPAVAADAGKPIPRGKNVPTEAKWNDELLSHRQAELEFYKKLTKDPPEVQKGVLDFMDGCLKKSFDNPDVSWEALEKQGDKLSAGGAKDPLFLSALGFVKRSVEKDKEGIEIAKAAFRDISTTNYPTSIKLKACARCRPAMPQSDKDSDPWQANMKETTRLAVEWLKETADQPEEQKFIWHEISPYMEEGWSYGAEYGKAQKNLFEAVEKAGKIHPWTKNMVEGVYYNSLAWRLRGTGFADTVKDEGWRGFQENIKKAAECLNEAWELDHTVPDAAACMIDVANSGAESDLSPREWFDRAVKARMDFEPAYEHYIHHLLPQWGGSHEQMYQFGLECMKTKRFDTMVPFQLIQILVTIDMQSESNGAIWHVPGVYENAQTVLENLENRPPHTLESSVKQRTPEWMMTLHGVIAAKAGRYSDARKAFDKVGMKLRKDAFAFAMSHFPLDGSRVYALTGGGREDVGKFEEIVAGGGLNDPATAKSARELLDKAAAATEEPQARSYFNHWKNHFLWQEQFEKGEWVELTFDKNFSMWQMKRGNWNFENPHSAVCDAHLRDVGFNTLTCEVAFQGPLEIECDVESLDQGYNYMSGVAVGDVWDYTRPQTGCVFYICPKGNSHGVYVPRTGTITALADTQAADHLRVQAWDGAYLYYLNDLDSPAQPIAGMTLGNKIELVAFRQRGALGRTRFSNIRVRKLTNPPPPMEKDANRLAYFDDLIAKHPQDGFLYCQRGLCRMSANQWAEAKADLTKAISLSSDISRARLALHEVEQSQGDFASAVEELKRYLKVNPDDVKANNYLAWTLAACRDAKVRNGKLAVEHARKACELTNYADVSNIDTLAVACAENGDFDGAVKWGAKAVELAVDHNAPMKPRFQNRLELYKAKKAYHDP